MEKHPLVLILQLMVPWDWTDFNLSKSKTRALVAKEKQICGVLGEFLKEFISENMKVTRDVVIDSQRIDDLISPNQNHRNTNEFLGESSSFNGNKSQAQLESNSTSTKLDFGKSKYIKTC